jgi:hypothetical protein
VIYKTAAALWKSASVVPPENGEYVNREGNYMTTERHAYLDGTAATLCGLPLSGMMAMWSELDWREGGDYPPRCGECAALAV